MTPTDYANPWRLGTLATGVAILIIGARQGIAPDWDVGVSLLMAGFTYWLAPWVAGVVEGLKWRLLPLAALATWWCVDGVYAAYWSLVDPRALELMRSANWPASLALFAICALIWRAPRS